MYIHNLQQDVAPYLRVFDGLVDLMFLELLVLDTGLVGADPLDHQDPIALRVALGPHGAAGHPPGDKDGPQAGDAAEDDEEDLPRLEDWRVDVADAVGEEATYYVLNAVLEGVSDVTVDIGTEEKELTIP